MTTLTSLFCCSPVAASATQKGPVAGAFPLLTWSLSVTATDVARHQRSVGRPSLHRHVAAVIAAVPAMTPVAPVVVVVSSHADRHAVIAGTEPELRHRRSRRHQGRCGGDADKKLLHSILLRFDTVLMCDSRIRSRTNCIRLRRTR